MRKCCVFICVIDMRCWKCWKTNGFGRFRHARAAAARMCPAWYYLTGIVALAGAQTLLKQFEVRAKAAREAPFDRNVEKPSVFEGFSLRARADFFDFVGWCNLCFPMFSWCRILNLLKNQWVCKDFDMRARRPRRCALRVIFLQWILEIWLC